MIASEHAIVAPVVLPLLAGAVLVVLERARPDWVRPAAVAAMLGGLAVALLLLDRAASEVVQTYLLGNWVAPFGIVFVLDRLSALMVMLTAVMASAALVWSLAGEDRAGPHFHALFQFQLAGLNGAFLTGDLFNLFVFFEVLLIASYGLLLHGGGAARLRAAVHYVAFNLAGSALFLIAVALLYSVTGTLNMADLSVKVSALEGTPAVLAQAAGALLFVVFAIKAALLPLYFWLPETYGAAATPVAALFAIMTKVGVYAMLRVTSLIFGDSGGEAAQLAYPILPLLAMATLVLAALGAVGATRLRVLVAYVIIASAGFLLLAFGLGQTETIAAGMFYLVNTTLVTGALFMLAHWIRLRRPEAEDRCVAQHDYPGRLQLALVYFVLAIAAAGLPPLAGFIGKALTLKAAWPLSLGPWVFAFVLGSSLLLVIAFARFGITLFWECHAAPKDKQPGKGVGKVRGAGGTPASPVTPAAPAAATAERLGIAILLSSALAAAAFAGPLGAYTSALAHQLTARTPYLESVRSKTPAPPAWDIRKEMRERGGK
ncbi:MAG: monovalent cation/H+ antiporter subunit D [Casimicrobiaceae bacterium]